MTGTNLASVYRLPSKEELDIKMSIKRRLAEVSEEERIVAAFTRLAPAFGHFGISVTCTGKRNRVWTLKGGGKVIKIASDGVIEVVK